VSVTKDPAAVFNSQSIAELFDSTEALVDGVSAFLNEGLSKGDASLVVMRLEHWNSVASNLTTRNVSLSDAIASGQLTVLDGARTLARIMLHGQPCRGLFEEVIEKPVRDICATGVRLRVYADLVDLLAADGNFDGARELEKMWSDFARHAPVTTLCGYSATTFSNPDASDTLRSICRSHINSRRNHPPAPRRAIPPVDQYS
jgi:hypothetical protein